MEIIKDGRLAQRTVSVKFWYKSSFNPQTGKYEEAVPIPIRTYNNLQCEFNITKQRGGLFDKADINITGLNAYTRNNIISMSYENYGNAKKPRPRYGISIDAGYAGQNAAEIYSGDICACMPVSTAPDITLKIECLTGFAARSIVLEKEAIKGGDFKNLCGSAAKALNLVLDYKAKENKSIDGFVHTGTGYMLIDKLRKLSNKVIIKVTDIYLHVFDNPPAMDKSPIVISQATGMIGIPKPTYQGTNVDALLNPKLNTGRWVDVQSKLIPQYNGLYNISILTHTGSLRGNNFYTKLQCTRHSGEAK